MYSTAITGPNDITEIAPKILFFGRFPPIFTYLCLPSVFITKVPTAPEGSTPKLICLTGKLIRSQVKTFSLLLAAQLARAFKVTRPHGHGIRTLFAKFSASSVKRTAFQRCFRDSFPLPLKVSKAGSLWLWAEACG